MKDIVEEFDKVIQQAGAIQKKQEDLLSQQKKAEQALYDYSKLVWNTQKTAETILKDLKDRLPKEAVVRHAYEIGASTKKFIVLSLLGVGIGIFALISWKNFVDNRSRQQQKEIEALRERLEYLETHAGSRLKEKYRKNFN